MTRRHLEVPRPHLVLALAVAAAGAAWIGFDMHQLHAHLDAQSRTEVAILEELRALRDSAGRPVAAPVAASPPPASTGRGAEPETRGEREPEPDPAADRSLAEPPELARIRAEAGREAQATLDEVLAAGRLDPAAAERLGDALQGAGGKTRLAALRALAEAMNDDLLEVDDETLDRL